MPYTTIALVDEVPQAHAASDDLHAAGFPSSTISLVFPQQHGEDLMRLPPAGRQTPVMGARRAIVDVADHVPGVATATLPGVHRWLATGPILTILSGVGLCGTADGMTRALVGLGLGQSDAVHFAARLAAGHILIAVRTDEESCSLLVGEILRHHGGRDITQSAWPHLVHDTGRLVRSDHNRG